MTVSQLDRFVPCRPPSLHHSSHSSSTLPTLAIESQTPDTSVDHSKDHTNSSLSASLGLPTSNRRILSFRSAPPPASHATSHLDAQRNYLLHASASSSRGVTTGGPGATNGSKKRAPPFSPDRVLDAPGFADDYYLNLVDWSCANRVAIGLGDMVYIWDAETGSVTSLGEGRSVIP